MEKKIGDVEFKISGINGSVTTAVLDTKLGEIEHKIPDVSELVKKEDYDTKITEIEGKYFTTAVYNKFTGNILDSKIK